MPMKIALASLLDIEEHLKTRKGKVQGLIWSKERQAPCFRAGTLLLTLIFDS